MEYEVNNNDDDDDEKLQTQDGESFRTFAEVPLI